MQQTVFYSSIQDQVYCFFEQMENFIVIWTCKADSAALREVEFCEGNGISSPQRCCQL